MDWPSDMGFGVVEVDAVERRLFAHVNAFSEAIAGGGRAETIELAFDQLMRDASFHFLEEERFFARVGYPLVKGHAALHRQMWAEFEQVKIELGGSRDRQSWIECGLLVKQLFVEHTRHESAVYRNLARAKYI